MTRSPGLEALILRTLEEEGEMRAPKNRLDEEYFWLAASRLQARGLVVADQRAGIVRKPTLDEALAALCNCGAWSGEHSATCPRSGSVGPFPAEAREARTKPCTCSSPRSGPGHSCRSPSGIGLGADWHCAETGARGKGARW